MLENSTYSVISPEGAASILWKDPSLAKQAAEAMRITAPDLKEMGIIDEIIPEVLGGAHRDPKAQSAHIGEAIRESLQVIGNFGWQKVLLKIDMKNSGQLACLCRINERCGFLCIFFVHGLS